MNAIYKGIRRKVTDERSSGLVLDHHVCVDYADPDLIVDPTDSEWEEADDPPTDSFNKDRDISDLELLDNADRLGHLKRDELVIEVVTAVMNGLGGIGKAELYVAARDGRLTDSLYDIAFPHGSATRPEHFESALIYAVETAEDEEGDT